MAISSSGQKRKIQTSKVPLLMESEHVIDITNSNEASSSRSAQARPVNGSNLSQNEDLPSTNAQPPISIARRGNGNGNGRHRSPLNSGYWISVELVITVSQIIAAVVVLSLSRDEHPHAPLFTWVIGYASGCVVTLPLLFWRFYNRNASTQEPLQARQSSSSASLSAIATSFTSSSNGDTHNSHGTSTRRMTMGSLSASFHHIMGFGGFDLLVLVMSTMCLIKCSLEFDPVDNYLLDCGSPRNSSVGDRVFEPDTSVNRFLSNPEQEPVSAPDSQTIPSTYGSSLYRTARILNRTSNFTFPINQHGRHFVRLYFFPFVPSTQTRNLSSSRFSVSARGFTLLKDFKPDSTPTVKEYSLNITSDELVITFTPSANSFAFINALEVISHPDELIPVSAETVELPKPHHGLTARALQTVARVNMGNRSVSPDDDTLWRAWNSDGPFIKQNNFVQFVSNLSAVNYTENGPSVDIAPVSVYGTLTKLDNEFNPGAILNNTWSFNVDPGFSYFVRFHFCDIVQRRRPWELVFNVYLNSMSVRKDLNLGQETSNVWGAPYFLDAVTHVNGNGMINVSIGTSSSGGVYPESILNGVEIMKISNNKGDLLETNSRTVSLTSRSNKKIWVIAVSAAGALFILAVLGFFIFVMSRRNIKKASNAGLTEQYPSPNESTIFSKSKVGYRFPLQAIQEATDKFNESLVIGIGGFGKVYKGTLFDGTIVAIKRGAPQSHQGLAEFQTEIEMLSQFRHRHLVSLIGYCDERNEMIIIYEYMQNGTLKNHLYGSDLPKLNWRQRLEICIGSAKGLHYLHTSSAKAIIHRDVKSANILLDENFMAKVADFGLSKNGPEFDQTHVSTAVKGSFGYLDPEYMTRQQLTEKSDVYSFGVVLFEVLCGRPVIDPSRPRGTISLVEWVKELKGKGELEKIIDPYLVGKMKMESLKKFVEIGDQCLADEGVDRPTMGSVLWNLEFALQLEGVEMKNGQTVNEPGKSHVENGVSSAMLSEGTMGDLDGVSMSRVFSEMVKGDKHDMR